MPHGRVACPVRVQAANGAHLLSVTPAAMPVLLAREAGLTVDLEWLVQAQSGTLLRLARRLVDDPDEARDLVQATLADACEKLATLREPMAAGPWLRRALFRRALNHLRRRRVWRAIREVFARTEPAAEGPDAALSRGRTMERVRQALVRLPARQQTAFALRYFEGLDLDEIAQVMGVGKGTVRTHLHRALVSLRDVLGPATGEVP